jgi:hypothetical protein
VAIAAAAEAVIATAAESSATKAYPSIAAAAAPHTTPPRCWDTEGGSGTVACTCRSIPGARTLCT